MKGMKTLFHRIERLENRYTPPTGRHDLELAARLERGFARLRLPMPACREDRRPYTTETIVEILNSGLARPYNPVL